MIDLQRLAALDEAERGILPRNFLPYLELKELMKDGSPPEPPRLK
jgi:hypothetical protein